MTEEKTTNIPEDVAAIEAPALPYTIHANLSSYRKRLGVLPIILAVLVLVIFGARFGFVGLAIMAVGVALLIFVILRILGGRTLTVTSEGLERATPFFGTRRVAFGDIDGVKVFINYVEGTFGAVPRVGVAVKNAGPITLNGLYWPAEELDKLLAIFRAHTINADYYAEPANYNMIAKQFPAYASGFERHPWLIAWGVVIGIVVVVTAAVLIFR